MNAKQFVVGGIVALVAIWMSGCDEPAGGEAARPAAAPVPVSLAPVQTGSLPRTVSVVGTLYGDEETTISAKVPGRVRQILADVGDRVSPGEALAEIDPVDYELVIDQKEMSVRQALARLGLKELPDGDFDVSTIATVERARFQAANARAKLNRAKQLFEQQPPLISEQDFADLQTANEVAQRDYEVALLEAQALLAEARSRNSELQTARQRLADTIVRAPQLAMGSTQPITTQEAPKRFGVAQRLVSIGEYVTEGKPMFRLVADDPIKLRASVPERHVRDVKVGQAVELRVEGQGQVFRGVVQRVSPAIDVASRTFQIEAVFDNPDRLLRPGAFARASILIGQRENVILVPRDAVVSFAGTTRVFSIQDGKAREHRVQPLTREDADHVPVEGDLEGVTEVIVSNTNRLADGVAVVVE